MSKYEIGKVDIQKIGKTADICARDGKRKGYNLA